MMHVLVGAGHRVERDEEIEYLEMYRGAIVQALGGAGPTVADSMAAMNAYCLALGIDVPGSVTRSIPTTRSSTCGCFG